MGTVRLESAGKYEILIFAVPSKTTDYNVKVQQSAFVNLDEAPLARFSNMKSDLAGVTYKYNSTTDDASDAMIAGIEYIRKDEWTGNIFITNPSLTTVANMVIYLS